MKPEKEEWQKDFESLWESSFDHDGEKEPFEFERLIDFIRQQLAKAREEGYKKGLKEKGKLSTAGHLQAVRSVV